MISIFSKIKNNILYVFLFFTCSISNIFAQDDDLPPEFEEEVLDNPIPAAPIDDWIIPMLVIAIILGYYIKQRKNQVVN
jgi:hypothetical protein